MDLLDFLAIRIGCNISDLKYEKLSEENRDFILETEEGMYTLENWNYAAGYICGGKCDFRNISDAKNAIGEHLR